jgi:hypothetical protein
MDNASNNKTMMEELGVSLTSRDIPFDPSDRYIMCFAHIIDLSSGQVIRKVEGMQNYKDDFDFSLFDNDDDDANSSNPIGAAHAVVRSIQASGTCRDAFNSIVKNSIMDGWFKDSQPSEATTVGHVQLLRDVRTRWDSMYYMLERLRKMRPVRLDFLLS